MSKPPSPEELKDRSLIAAYLWQMSLLAWVSRHIAVMTGLNATVSRRSNGQRRVGRDKLGRDAIKVLIDVSIHTPAWGVTSLL